MTDDDDLVDMGRVIDAYGVRGQLKVEPFAGTDSALSKAKSILLQHPGKSGQYRVRQIKDHSGSLIVALEGFADRDFAASWKGATVQMSRAQFPATEPDEVYWVDLIGCRVVGTNDVALGTVLAVDDHGGGPFLRVQSEPEDTQVKTRERLIPFVDAYITGVHLADRLIEADWDSSWD